MAKFETMIKGDFYTISNRLHQDILGSAMSMQLKESKEYTIGDVKISLHVYDKYFARTSSRTSLSVQIVGQGDTVGICAITAGGGNGAFFNFSWGAEESLTDVVSNSLAKM